MRLEPMPPSHDSFSRLFRTIELKPFTEALVESGIRQIAIDGGAHRPTFSHASGGQHCKIFSTFAPGSCSTKLTVGKIPNVIRTLKANQRSVHMGTKTLLDAPEDVEKMLLHQGVERENRQVEMRAALVSHGIGRPLDLRSK